MRASGEFVGLISCILAVVSPQDNIAKFDLELSLSFSIHTDGVGVCVRVFDVEAHAKKSCSLTLSLSLYQLKNEHAFTICWEIATISKMIHMWSST